MAVRPNNGRTSTGEHGERRASDNGGESERGLSQAGGRAQGSQDGRTGDRKTVEDYAALEDRRSKESKGSTPRSAPDWGPKGLIPGVSGTLRRDGQGDFFRRMRKDKEKEKDKDKDNDKDKDQEEEVTAKVKALDDAMDTDKMAEDAAQQKQAGTEALTGGSEEREESYIPGSEEDGYQARKPRIKRRSENSNEERTGRA
eukprot:14718184-Heterocapsa_arctica.AAC.2